MGRLHSLADGPTDWGTVFDTTDESEDGVPTAPKRVGSSTFDDWWVDCGRVVSVRSDELSQGSTQWTKDLRKWTRHAERSERRKILVGALSRARFELDFLAMRLKETIVGKQVHKRRKTAEMNARYVGRKYVGKKLVAARKAKRAAAARDRRWRKYAKSHGVDLATDIQFSQ